MTTEERIDRLERRLKAQSIVQKRTLDAIMTIGISADAWDHTQVSRVLHDLAAALSGVCALEEITDTGIDTVAIKEFTDAISYDAQRLIGGSTPRSPDNRRSRDPE